MGRPASRQAATSTTAPPPPPLLPEPSLAASPWSECPPPGPCRPPAAAPIWSLAPLECAWPPLVLGGWCVKRDDAEGAAAPYVSRGENAERRASLRPCCSLVTSGPQTTACRCRRPVRPNPRPRPLQAPGATSRPKQPRAERAKRGKRGATPASNDDEGESACAGAWVGAAGPPPQFSLAPPPAVDDDARGGERARAAPNFPGHTHQHRRRAC